MLRRSVVVWVIIIMAETIHGVARVLLLQPHFCDFRAREIGVFNGSNRPRLVICPIAGFNRGERISDVFVVYH